MTTKRSKDKKDPQDDAKDDEGMIKSVLIYQLKRFVLRSAHPEEEKGSSTTSDPAPSLPLKDLACDALVRLLTADSRPRSWEKPDRPDATNSSSGSGSDSSWSVRSQLYGLTRDQLDTYLIGDSAQNQVIQHFKRRPISLPLQLRHLSYPLPSSPPPPSMAHVHLTQLTSTFLPSPTVQSALTPLVVHNVIPALQPLLTDALAHHVIPLSQEALDEVCKSSVLYALTYPPYRSYVTHQIVETTATTTTNHTVTAEDGGRDSSIYGDDNSVGSKS